MHPTTPTVMHDRNDENKAAPRGHRRCAGGKTDRRGSAIVLVLVSVVLMAILAATLLQLTRFERIPQTKSNIDAVVESVIAEILNQATDDLLDDNGNLFNIKFLTFGNGGGDEPYDYPWTNPRNFYLRQVTEDGTTYNLFGGVMDDIWLSSSQPDFRTVFVDADGNAVANADVAMNTAVRNNTVGVWRKITNLTGLALYGDNGGTLTSDLSVAASPTIRAMDSNSVATPERRDHNLLTNDVTLVDTDGDGIGDARWEWAPLRQIGTTQYVMAVRIIDMSSRIDLNTALGATALQTGTTATLGGLEPRGDNPTEIDGTYFVHQAAQDQGLALTTAMGEWLNVIEYRVKPGTATFNGSTVPYDGDTEPAADRSRYHFWEFGASRTSYRLGRADTTDMSGTGFDYGPNSAFTTQDAFELLYRNGLNSTTVATIETLMPLFLRSGAEEDNFGTTGGGPISVNTTPGTTWTQRQFWERDVRKQLTTVSGHAQLNPTLAENEAGSLKIDVNQAVKTAAGRTALRNAIREVFDAGNTNSINSRYPHLTNSTQVANQLTANITDYIDSDNAITLVGAQAGFECLPYITEVYTQKTYNATAVNAGAGTGGTDIVTWEPADTTNSSTGYVIEIGNPFARRVGNQWVGRPVKLTGVWLKYNTGTALSLVDDLGAPNELKPGEVLQISRNSRGTTGTDTDGNDWDLLGTEAGGDPIFGPAANSYTTVIPVTGPILPANDTTPTIKLEAEMENINGDPSGTASGWSYCEIEIQVADRDDNITEEVAPGQITLPGPGGSAQQGMVITSYMGDGSSLRMMAVGSNAYDYGADINTLSTPSANANTTTREVARNTAPDLGGHIKSNRPGGYNILSRQQIVWHDNPRERMQWIGDILQIPVLGPDYDASGNASTMASVINTANINRAGGLDLTLLPYERMDDAGNALPNASNPVINTNGGINPASPFSLYGRLNFPHSVLLLERLTTFNPAMDNRDGDGQGETESVANPDEDEALVPGKLNLNTASYNTLVRALPFPSLTYRQQVAAEIIERRESLRQNTNYRVGADSLAGIMYVGGLYDQLEQIEPVASNGGNMSRITGDTQGVNGVRVDLNDYETAPGTFADFSGTPLADGVADDREEQIMLAKWLSEVASTRSDVFAAYIVVQGYTADGFDAGVKESKRLMIIFSRANVKNAGDRAVEIGRFVIE